MLFNSVWIHSFFNKKKYKCINFQKLYHIHCYVLHTHHDHVGRKPPHIFNELCLFFHSLLTRVIKKANAMFISQWLYALVVCRIIFKYRKVCLRFSAVLIVDAHEQWILNFYGFLYTHTHTIKINFLMCSFHSRGMSIQKNIIFTTLTINC